MFGDDHKAQIFIAKHRPWNCTVKEGVEVAITYLDGDTSLARTASFLTGFIVDNGYVDRPVDVATTPDAELMAQGAQLAQDHRSASCHGADDTGGCLMPPLRHKREGYLAKGASRQKASR